MVRVTEVIGYLKEPWYIDWVHRVGRTEANKIAKAAMKVGSRVDELIKATAFDTNLKMEHKEPAEVQTCIGAYRKWLDVYKPKSIVNGTRLYAKIEGVDVTGEPDIFVDDVLVDIKCSSKISLSYWVQVNVYRFLDQMANERISHPYKVAILRLDKVTGSFEYVVKDYDQKCVDVWMGLFRAFLYYKGDSDGDELREVGAVKEVA